MGNWIQYDEKPSSGSVYYVDIETGTKRAVYSSGAVYEYAPDEQIWVDIQAKQE